jgi:hypothetical protein
LLYWGLPEDSPVFDVDDIFGIYWLQANGRERTLRAMVIKRFSSSSAWTSFLAVANQSEIAS